MVKFLTVILALTVMFTGCVGEPQPLSSMAKSESEIRTDTPAVETKLNNDEDEKNTLIDINLTIGDSVFSAKLYDNSAAKALLAQFPITLNMSDLNGNEKYYYLAENLPSAPSERPQTINNGDIMCWSGNCLVLFYKTFSNSYGGYVRLGYVEDISEFAAELGNGNVQITFSAVE